jgi:hypothetical protein
MAVLTVGIRRTREGDLRMSAPYLPTFPRAARALGADFDKSTKEWIFPVGAPVDPAKGQCTEQAVLDLVVQYYGTTGIDDAELCDVRVALGLHGSQRRGFFALGREIANRDRQGVFRLGHGVTRTAGTLPADMAGGDATDLIGQNDAVVVVSNVPRCLANREMRLYSDSMEIVGADTPLKLELWTARPGAPLPSGRDNLGELRRNLLARLAEVQQAINAAEEVV